LARRWRARPAPSGRASPPVRGWPVTLPLGLGRIVAVYHRASTSYHIHSIIFRSDNASEPYLHNNPLCIMAGGPRPRRTCLETQKASLRPSSPSCHKVFSRLHRGSMVSLKTS
jgi:hypothetical protein